MTKPTSAWIVVGPDGTPFLSSINEDVDNCWQQFTVAMLNTRRATLISEGHTCQRVTICAEGDVRDAERWRTYVNLVVEDNNKPLPVNDPRSIAIFAVIDAYTIDAATKAIDVALAAKQP